MKFDKIVNEILKENENQQATKKFKIALLTTRLPYEVKEDIERISKERDISMTAVVEGYRTVALAMERLAKNSTNIYEEIKNAKSPQEIERILHGLIPDELPMESTMVEENFLEMLKNKISSASINIKTVFKFLAKFLGGFTESKSSKEGVSVLSDLLYVYAKNN